MQLIDERCPECKSVNWVNNGDTDDLTVDDIEAICCWKCNHEFFICEEVPMMTPGLKPGDANIEDGRQTAAEALNG